MVVILPDPGVLWWQGAKPVVPTSHSRVQGAVDCRPRL